MPPPRPGIDFKSITREGAKPYINYPHFIPRGWQAGDFPLIYFACFHEYLSSTLQLPSITGDEGGGWTRQKSLLALRHYFFFENVTHNSTGATERDKKNFSHDAICTEGYKLLEGNVEGVM